MTRRLGEKFAEGLGLDFYIHYCLYLVAGRERDRRELKTLITASHPVKVRCP